MTREERLALWFNDAKIGMGFHWGMASAPYEPVQQQVTYASVTDWEKAVTEEFHWTPGVFLDVAAKLRANYIVWVTAHGAMGDIATWRTNLWKNATTRDFLGEALAACKPRGIKILVYLHLSANGAHIKELAKNYPELPGVWLDGDPTNWEDAIREIRLTRPDFLVGKNTNALWGSELADVASSEEWQRGYVNDYDFAAGCIVPPHRGIEIFYPVNCAPGIWWYDGQDLTMTPQKEAIEFRKALSARGSSFTPVFNLEPKTGGGLPGPLMAWVDKVDAFMSWAGESILQGTEGGGFNHGGFPPGYWPNGSYGFTTLRPGTDTHYIHVCTPPTTPALVIPDGGYRVSGAIDLKSGAALDFSQKDGFVTVTPPTGTWADLTAGTLWDFIVKLTAAPCGTVVPHSGMTANPARASAVIDDDYFNFFSGNQLVLDLGKEYAIKYVMMGNHEDSACLPSSWGHTTGPRIKDYRLFVSGDGSTWDAPVKTGTLFSQRGVQQIYLDPAVSGRYLKLEVLTTWGDGDPRIGNVDVMC